MTLISNQQIMRLRILIIFVFFATSLIARNYSIDQVEINTFVNPDGSMTVEETRVFNYQGKYSYAYREFPKDQGINFTQFKVFEQDQEYYLAENQQPGTYIIQEKDNTTVVKWFYKVNNIDKKFTISYLVEKSIQKYQDTSVLYYRFISKGWDKTNYNVSLSIHPPTKVSSTEIKYWCHGILWFDTRISQDGIIFVNTEKIKKDQFLELRILYPNYLFPNLLTQPDHVKENISIKEAEWTRELILKREKEIRKLEITIKRIQISRWLMPLCGLLILILWFYFINRKVVFHKISKTQISYRKPDLKPAFSHGLLNYYEMDIRLFISTLFNLASRGFVSIREEREKKRDKPHLTIHSLKHQDELENLNDFELDIMYLLFKELGQGSEVSFTTLKKKRIKLLSRLGKWKRMIKQNLIEKGFIDKKNLKLFNLSLLFSISSLVLSLICLVLFQIWALFMIVVALFGFFMSFLIPIHTKLGKEMVYQIKMFKKNLKNIILPRSQKLDLQKEIINDLLIYGSVFGFSTGLIKKNLKKFDPKIVKETCQWYHPDGNIAEFLTDLELINSITGVFVVLYANLGASSSGTGGISAGGASSGAGGAG